MEAATLWYHDHVIDRTGHHVIQGLAGFYLISDDAQDALNLPSGEYDVPLMLQDRRFDAESQFYYQLDRRTRIVGYRGDEMCVNGQIRPRHEVADVKYRFRILNGSNARHYQLALESGDPFTVIANDGGLLEAPTEVRVLEIFPGERYDVVVDFSSMPVGSEIRMVNLFNEDVDPVIEEIMRFEVVRTEQEQHQVPSALRTIEQLDPAEASVVRRFEIRGDATEWTINGLAFDGARVDARCRLGDVEIWEFDKPGLPGHHPMHIHLVQFQVLDINGAPPPPHMRGWKDTVGAVQGVTRVIARFAPHTGLYLFHCHILEHEDHHMMAQFMVEDPNNAA